MKLRWMVLSSAFLLSAALAGCTTPAERSDLSRSSAQDAPSQSAESSSAPDLSAASAQETTYTCGYTDETGTRIDLPVLIRSRELSWDTAEVALAAQDGSWNTDFDYLGCIAFPGGLAVGDEDGMSILNPETGEALRSWTWDALGLDGPQDVAWVTGDAYCTAQWVVDKLYLGDTDPDHIRMLDPETGVMTEGDHQALLDYFEQVYNGES